MDRLHQEVGSGVLEQEAAGSGLERAMDVLVEIEGGDHHHRERVLNLWPSELAGRRDPVQAGHPDVEQAHVGAELTGQLHRFEPVDRLTDHLDTGLRTEDHRQPGADEFLVVRDQHPDRHLAVPVLGSTARTVQPRSGPGPASKEPPRSVARSFIPTNP
jgi:hypothetical protein